MASAIQRRVSGKLVGSSPTGRITQIAPPSLKKVKPKKPGTPNINQWLAGDTVYKQQMDAANRANSDYSTQFTGQQNTYNTEYTRNLLNSRDNQKQAGINQADDYASRGMSHSGLRLKAAADTGTEYAKAESTLSGGRAEFMANLRAAKTNFSGERTANMNKYRNEAINRRASRYAL